MLLIFGHFLYPSLGKGKPFFLLFLKLNLFFIRQVFDWIWPDLLACYVAHLSLGKFLFQGIKTSSQILDQFVLLVPSRFQLHEPTLVSCVVWNLSVQPLDLSSKTVRLGLLLRGSFPVSTSILSFALESNFQVLNHTVFLADGVFKMLFCFAVPLIRLWSSLRIISKTSSAMLGFLQLQLLSMQFTLQLDNLLCVLGPSINHVIAQFSNLLVFYIQGFWFECQHFLQGLDGLVGSIGHFLLLLVVSKRCFGLVITNSVF